MIQVKNLTITHRRDLRTILNDFSLVLREGDKVALIGEEGNGKSTLLKLIHDPALVEDYAEYTGEIIRNGVRTGYLAQELSGEQKKMSVYQFCAGREAFYERTPGELKRIAGRLGFPADFFYLERPVGTLSGGEKVRLQIAGILMEQPDVFLKPKPVLLYPFPSPPLSMCFWLASLSQTPASRWSVFHTTRHFWSMWRTGSCTWSR